MFAQIAQCFAGSSNGVTSNCGDLATWVTGLATVALFVIGFAQIWNERTLRIKRDRTQELATRRAQAELISAWWVTEIADPEREEENSWIAILNRSHQPVYQAVVTLVILGQSGELSMPQDPDRQACIGVIPPGKGYISIRATVHGMMKRAGVEIAFQDGAGTCWVRKALGDLVELPVSPAEHYQIDLPANWQTLDSELPERVPQI